MCLYFCKNLSIVMYQKLFKSFLPFVPIFEVSGLQVCNLPRHSWGKNHAAQLGGWQQADLTILLWRRVISTDGKQHSWAFALSLATLPVLSSFPCEDTRVQGSANARRMPAMIAHLTWMIYLGQSRAHHALQPQIIKLVIDASNA